MASVAVVCTWEWTAAATERHLRKNISQIICCVVVGIQFIYQRCGETKPNQNRENQQPNLTTKIPTIKCTQIQFSRSCSFIFVWQSNHQMRFYSNGIVLCCAVLYIHFYFRNIYPKWHGLLKITPETKITTNMKNDKSTKEHGTENSTAITNKNSHFYTN